MALIFAAPNAHLRPWYIQCSLCPIQMHRRESEQKEESVFQQYTPFCIRAAVQQFRLLQRSVQYVLVSSLGSSWAAVFFVCNIAWRVSRRIVALPSSRATIAWFLVCVEDSSSAYLLIQKQRLAHVLDFRYRAAQVECF